MATRSNSLWCNAQPLLALLLFACISWGATAEFTHHHGSQRSLAVVPSVSTVEGAVSTPSFDTDSRPNSSSRTSTGLDCLICQLHQNLSTTTLEQPAGAPATQSQTFTALTADLFHFSQFAAQSHGRAPPRTSLS